MFYPAHDVAMDTFVTEQVDELFGAIFICPEIFAHVSRRGRISPGIIREIKGDGTSGIEIGLVWLRCCLEDDECRFRNMLLSGLL